MQWIRKHISRREDQDKQDPTPPPAAAEQMESSRAQNLENPSSNSQEPPASQYSSKDPMLPKGSQNPEMVKTTGPPLRQSIEEENPEKKQPSQDDEDLASVGRQENKEEVVGSDGVLEGKDEEEEQDKAGAVVAAAEEEEDQQGEEECLVSIPGTVVHMVDDEESPHLATGVFSIVRITQKGNGILVLANVGHNLHWPVMKDMPTVKLDPTHYFFSLPLTPVMMDDDDNDDEAPHPNGDNNQNENESRGKDLKVLTYGVTFPLQGSDTALPVLDSLLEHYSQFSSPTVIHEDKEKDEQMEKKPEEGLHIASRSMNLPTDGKPNDYNGMVIPPQQVTRKGKKMEITERNQADFWTTMAPNVDDYGSSAARAIATGSGQVTKGIFWVRDSTMTKLDNGSIYMQSKLKANNKPHNVSPRVLRNLHRVRRMSRATENVTKGVLTGVIVTTGFFEGAIIKSSAGKKIFKLMPGEVALVSLDAFGKLFDAVEKTSRDILQSTSIMTQNVVGHRFGDSAAKVAEETLATAGHVVATAWTVTKLRKALNPKASPAGGASKLTKTGLLKAAAKNTLKGGKK